MRCSSHSTDTVSRVRPQCPLHRWLDGPLSGSSRVFGAEDEILSEFSYLRRLPWKATGEVPFLLEGGVVFRLVPANFMRGEMRLRELVPRMKRAANLESSCRDEV